MPRVHVVKQGETIVALSERYGLFAQTIWDHPDNTRVRTLRRRMDVLLPGDEVVIPDLREKVVSAATGKVHPFRRRGIPAVFRLVLRERSEPRVGVAWRLIVGGVETSGVTGEDGLIEQYVPALATEGRLFLDESETPILLRFGHLDPVTSLSGVRKRLANMGMSAPEGDDLDDIEWRDALVELQLRAGLPQTGLLDDKTRQALVTLHDLPAGGRTR